MSTISESNIVKAGYLVKSAGGRLSGWKKRYFILTGSTLRYFEDHTNLEKPKGDLLLTPNTTVLDIAVSTKLNCLKIGTPFAIMILATNDEAERSAWKRAIQYSIDLCKTSLRGYVSKKGGMMEGKVRKFFIVNENLISYYKDHEHTADAQGTFTVNETTAVEAIDASCKLNLVNKAPPASLLLRFGDASDEYERWKAKIMNLVAVAKENVNKASLAAVAAEPVLRKGVLKMRSAKGVDTWEPFLFVLTPSKVTAFDTTNKNLVRATFFVSPICSVFETNLCKNAFEFVTPKQILHVQAENKDEVDRWIKDIRDAINESPLEDNNPFLDGALAKIPTDVMYDASFFEEKPLGIVLERAGEWAMVKIATNKDVNVAIGSALMAVNGMDVSLLRYVEAISTLKNWRPPLRMTFLKPPEKEGYLMKESRGRRSNSRNWKRRYFVLKEGKLIYKESNTATEAKGEIPLIGSGISIQKFEETGKYFCLRIVSGVTRMIVQAESYDELVEWGSVLYHAIGIANGGAHILRYKRNQLERSKINNNLESSDINTVDSAAAGEGAAQASAAGGADSDDEGQQGDDDEPPAQSETVTAQMELEEAANTSDTANREVLRQRIARAVDLNVDESVVAEALEKLHLLDSVAEVMERAQADLAVAVQSRNAAAIEDAIDASVAAGCAESTIRGARALLLEVREEEARAQAELQRQREAEAQAAANAAREAREAAEAQQRAAMEAEKRAEAEAEAEARAAAEAEARAAQEAAAAAAHAQALAVAAAEAAAAVAAAEARAVQEAEAAAAEARAAEEAARVHEAQRLAEAEAAAAAEAAASAAEAQALADAESQARELEEALTQSAETAGSEEGQDDDENGVQAESVNLSFEGGSSAFASASRDEPELDDETFYSDDEEGEGESQIGSSPAASGRKARRPSQLFSDGRKLASRSERLRREQLAREGGSQDVEFEVTDEQLNRVFDAYAKISGSLDYATINAIQFSSLWRLITANRGNLFQEMKIFNQFDAGNNGVLSAKDFRDGWRKYYKSTGDVDLVERMLSLAGRGSGEDANMIL